MDAVGQVFTPPVLAKFAVQQAGLVALWLSGKSVLDPTMGNGALLASLAEAAVEGGHPAAELPFSLLHGIEIDPALHAEALEFFLRRYGVDLSPNLICGDLFELAPSPCDLIFSNPPWANFCDLPENIKPEYKRRFVRYGLAPDRSKLLLGGSRIDLAALFVQKTLLENLRPGGRAWFFLPLSLLLNDGAHTAFRSYETGGVPFSIEAVHDFQSEAVFGVSTRWGLVSLLRDTPTTFPLSYYLKEGGGWKALEASPLFDRDNPLSIHDPGRSSRPRRLTLEKRSVPRQGVNTGGANRVFFFSSCEGEGESRLMDGLWRLPRALVHPLLTSRQFRLPDAPAEKWVLLPYDGDGKVLSRDSVAESPLLLDYLEAHRRELEARRGALVATQRSRGLWWSLQGVGPYSFAPYKVVWEAYGRKTFRPRLFAGQWQANQALQAFVPCWSAAEAERVLQFLLQDEVESYLQSLKMEGTANWAQPGRIKKLLQLSDPTVS